VKTTLNGTTAMTPERLNKLVLELGNSIFTNEPNLHPGDLTMEKVRFYAEGCGFDLTEKELDELIVVTFHVEHIVHVPTVKV